VTALCLLLTAMQAGTARMETETMRAAGSFTRHNRRADASAYSVSDAAGL